MMDFVRRLAPQREADVTRAVAVLPSRFASENPLRATIGGARPAQRHPITGVQSVQTAIDTEPTRSVNEEATPLARPLSHAQGGAPDIGVDEAHAFQERNGTISERAKPIRLEMHDLAAASAARHDVQSVTAPLAAPRLALPLSQAILAQRTLQSRDDNQVVHVTIGRIDVVANTAAAPAIRRTPTPRQPTVTLADYLRGGSGSRR